MLLEPQDVELFFRLHRSLMFFVNQRLKVIPDKLVTSEEFATLPPEVRINVRDALTANVDLIESFVTENPAHLSKEELDIVHSWRHLVADRFYVFRELTKYTVFLKTTSPMIAYGVVALSQPFEDLIGPHLPVMTQTVLLPFKDKIVYDGLMSNYHISFGPGIRRSLNEGFNEAKIRHGIVTSLPILSKPVIAKTPTAKPRPKPNPKEETAEVLAIVIDLIERFCRDHLNDEYAAICRRLAEKLARKRPSPLVSGKPATWACGIVRTIGWVNFLDDKSQSPHMKLTDIDKAFGIGASTGQGKSMSIRKMFKIGTFAPDWTLPSRLDDNPMVWTLNVNGFLMDIRLAPREAQEIAFEQGLIPYIPNDRVDESEDE